MATSAEDVTIETNDDIVQALNEYEIEESEKQDIKKWLSERNYLRVAVAGKTGAGKSSLLNGFIGLKVFKEGDKLEPETSEVSEARSVKGNIEVIAWDCPGLHDGTKNEKRYLQDLKRKTQGQLDLLMYCVSVEDPRFDMLRHTNAIRKITTALGKDVWKHSLVVLTFCNYHVTQLSSKRLPEREMEGKFEAFLASWKEKVKEALQTAGISRSIIKDIPIVPAGYHKQPHLPGHPFWLSELWVHCLKVLKDHEARKAILMLNKDRIRQHEKYIKEGDFDKDIHEQPIVFTSTTKSILASFGINLGTMAAGAAIGGTILGIAVGIPTLGAGAAIGAAAGAAVGSTVGAVVGMLINTYRLKRAQK